MSVKQNPGMNKRRLSAADLPVSEIRRFWSTNGDVTYINSKGATVTVLEAEMASHNNMATHYKEITSITGSAIWVEE